MTRLGTEEMRIEFNTWALVRLDDGEPFLFGAPFETKKHAEEYLEIELVPRFGKGIRNLVALPAKVVVELPGEHQDGARDDEDG